MKRAGISVLMVMSVVLLLCLPAGAAPPTGPPPVPTCFDAPGWCNNLFLKGPVSPAVLTTGPEGLFTLGGPANIDTTHPVACGDAGCLYNHFNWVLTGATIVSGCDGNNPLCKVQVNQNKPQWAAAMVVLNDYPERAFLLWSSSARKISGKVTDASGKPVAGTKVTMVDSSTGTAGGSATTAGDGSYSADVQPGTYRVTPTGGEHSSFAPASVVITVVGADATGVDFVRHDPVTLSGTVLGIGGHGGQPNVTVTATGAHGNVGTATTAADGTYAMAVEADTYTVVPSAGDATLRPSSLAVDATGGDAQANFALGYQVLGTAYQTHCSGGCRRETVAGVTVTAAPQNGGEGGAVTTGADGAWSLLLGPGDYELTPTDDDNSNFNPESSDVSLHAKPPKPLDFYRCADTPAGTATEARYTTRAKTLCDPDGIDWEMPERLTTAVASRWNTGEGLPSRSFVNPKSWTVKLFTTDDGKPLACSGDVKYEWKIDKLPKGAKVVDKPAEGCKTTAKVSRLGNYHVAATKFERVKGKWKKAAMEPLKATVVVRDWLLTGMGDSNGSGEGNPPFFFERCNRSVQSYQFVSALYLEQHDPHSSVTFLFTSCSGARIEHLVDTDYEGIRRGPGALPPQISQVDFLLADREGDPSNQPPERTPDAGILSIGVNNLGFGPLLSFCVEQRILHQLSDCPDLPATTVPDGSGGVKTYKYDPSGKQTLRARLNTRLRDLRKTYKQLATQLAKPISIETKDGGFGAMPSANLLVTQYPDFSHNDDGGTCDTYLKTNILTAWSAVTWGWLGSAGSNLDATILAAAHDHGWTGVTLNQTPFLHHGYCAADSGFVGIPEALWRENKDGAFHPTTNGHRITAQGVIPKLCRRLYRNAECDGIVKYKG